MTFIEPDTVFTSDVFKKRFKGFEEVLIKKQYLNFIKKNIS